MLLCPKCGNKLEVETEIEQYPFVCKVCDENFFKFEGEKMNDIVYFEAVKGIAHLKGYVLKDEIDDDESIHFLTEEGFDTAQMKIFCDIPWNTDEETKFHANQDANALLEAWEYDEDFLQYLWDFRDENKTVKREGYTLHINEGEKIEV